MKKGIPTIILEELEDSGLNWALEEGSKHHKIKVNGRLVGILPKGSGSMDARAILNTRSQIRRAVKEMLPR